MGEMTWIREGDSCLIHCDVEKITGCCQVWTVVSGLGREQTHASPQRGFGALKYDVRHAALVKNGKKTSKARIQH
jgi:hypothetical protein